MSIIYRIKVRGRDIGEGPWTSRKAAQRFLNSEVGARGARVVKCRRAKRVSRRNPAKKGPRKTMEQIVMEKLAAGIKLKGAELFLYPDAEEKYAAWKASQAKSNPRLKYDSTLRARVGPYTFAAGDAAYDWVDVDRTATAIWVEAFDQDIPNTSAGREMFWDALAMFYRGSPGHAIVSWYKRRNGGKHGGYEWVFAVIKRGIAKKTGTPYLTMRDILSARRHARSGRIPRAVKVLEA
jgi:hypothetical protein